MDDELVATTQRMFALEGASDLRGRFDEATACSQVLALVSPTCPVCLEGVALVLEDLRKRRSSEIDVHIAWMPVLDADCLERAEAAAVALESDARVWQYWDVTREISAAAHEVLGLERYGRSVAWDVYLFYRAGARWSQPLPVPDTWLHQLRIVDQPSLDTETLQNAFEKISS